MIFRAHCCIAFHARKPVSLPCDYFFVPNVPHGGATLWGQLHSCSIESKTKPVEKSINLDFEHKGQQDLINMIPRM